MAHHAYVGRFLFNAVQEPDKLARARLVTMLKARGIRWSADADERVVQAAT